MRVTALFFGKLSESVDRLPVLVSLDADADVSALRRWACANHSASRAALSTCMMAVNERYAAETQRLVEGDVIAFLPPVSGG